MAAFVDFYLEGLPDFLGPTGYVAVPDPDVTRTPWEARRTT